MAVTADLAKLLDKAYEDKTLAELVDAPVSALSGVSEDDAKLLAEAFNVKTIGDLGRNKFFRAATAFVDLPAPRSKPAASCLPAMEPVASSS
jgi:hypothetical protein